MLFLSIWIVKFLHWVTLRYRLDRIWNRIDVEVEILFEYANLDFLSYIFFHTPQVVKIIKI